jgi:8-oxo-dGTP diphosphatase
MYLRKVPFTYAFARPALAVDCVVFGYRSEQLMLLLIERGEPPFEGKWALPGGFVRIDETLDRAAERELVEEAGLKLRYLEQLYTFGSLERDPRERVVTVAYFALVNTLEHELRASTDAKRAAWFDVREQPTLAFDHDGIVERGLERLRSKVRYQPIGFGLLDESFTLSELQRLYEVILGRALDKRNFRKKILKLGFIVPTDQKERGVARRAARFFKFDRTRYEALSERGFDLELL